MIDKIVSALKTSPTSDFVYSSMSFFAPRAGGELPGAWFIDALGSIGVEAQAIRQTLFRLERSGVLVTRRERRSKWYRAAPSTEAVLATGRARVAEPIPSEWDGLWTLVHFRVGEDDREGRDRLRDLLLVEGFGALSPGLYLQARDRSARVVNEAKTLGLADRVHVFRGAQVAGPATARLALELWDLPAVARRYRRFVTRFEAIEREPAKHWTPFEAFALRFAFMFEFFRITWDDPALPPSLLPDPWPAEDARRIAKSLMTKLLPGALAFADGVLDRAVANGRLAMPVRS